MLSLRTCSLCTIFLVQHIVVAISIIDIIAKVQSFYNLLSLTYSSCSYHCYHFERVVFVQSFQFQHIVVAPSIIVITSNVQSLYNLFSSTYSSCSQYHCYHFERVVFVQSFQFNLCYIVVFAPFSPTYSSCSQHCYHFERVVFVQSFQSNIQQLLLVSLLSLRTCSLCTIFLVQHIVVAPSIIVITSNVQSLYNLFSSTYCSCSQYHCYHFDRVVFVQSFQFKIQQSLLVPLLSLRTCSLCTIFLVQHIVVAPSIIVITSNVQSLYNLFSSTYSSCSQYHCYHFERVVFVQSFFNILQLLLVSLLSLRTCSLCTILVQHIAVVPSIIVITSNVQSLYNLFSSTYSSCSQHHCYHFERVVFVQSFQSNIQQLLLVSLLSLRTCSLCTILLVQHIVVARSIIVITSNVQSLYNRFSSTYSSCSWYHCYHFERVVFVQSFQSNIQQLLLASLLSLRTCSLCTIFLVQHIVVAPSIIVITSNVQSLYNRFSSRYSSRSWYLCYHFERVVFVQSFQSNIQQLLLVSLLSLRTCSLCTIFLVQHIVVAISSHCEGVVFLQSSQFNIQQLLLTSLLSLRTCSLCTIFLVQHIVVAPSIIVITSNVQSLYNLFSSWYIFVVFAILTYCSLVLLSLRTCSLCTIVLVQDIVVAPGTFVITSNVQSLYNLFSPTYSSCQYHCYHFERVVFVQSFSSTYSSCSQYHCYHFERVVFVQSFPTYSSCSQYHCYHFERVVFVQSFQFKIQQSLLVSLLSLRTCSLCTIFLVQHIVASSLHCLSSLTSPICYHFERVVFVQSFQFQHIVVAPSIIVITSNVQSLYNLFSSTYSSCSQYHCYHFERVVFVQSFQFKIQQSLLVPLLSLRTCSLCTIFLVQHIVVAPSIIVITSNVQSLYNRFSSTYSSCSQYHCYHFERVVFVQSFQSNIQQLLLASLLSLRTCSLLYNLFSSTYSSCSQYHCYHFERVVFVQSFSPTYSSCSQHHCYHFERVALYNLFSSTYCSCSQYHCYHFERVVFVQSFQFKIQQSLLVPLLSLRTCSLCTIFLVQHIVVAPSIIVITSNVQSLYNLFSSTYSSCSQYHCYHFERVVFVQSFSSTYSSCSQYHCYHFDRVVFVQSFQFKIQQSLLVPLLSLRTCSLCTIFQLSQQHIVVCSQYHCYHFERVVFVQSFQFNIQQLLLASLLSLRTCSLCTIFLVQHIVVAPSIIVITSNVQPLYNLFSSTYCSCSQYHCYHFDRVVFVQSFQFKIQQSLLVPLLSLRTCSLCTIFLVQHIVVAPSIIVITSNVQSLYNLLVQHIVVAPSIIVITSNVQSLYNLFSSTYSSCSQYHCYHFERVVFVQSFQFNIQQLLLVSLLSLRTCSLCTIFLVQHIVVAPSIIVITSNVQSLYNLFSSTYSSCSQYHCYHFERVVFVQSYLVAPSIIVITSNVQFCTIVLVQDIVVAPGICYHFERVVFVQSFQSNIQQLQHHSSCNPSIIVITSNVQSLYNRFSSRYSSRSWYLCYHFERVVFVQSFQFNIQQLLLVSLLSLRTCSLCTIFLVQHIVVAPSIIDIIVITLLV